MSTFRKDNEQEHQEYEPVYCIKDPKKILILIGLTAICLVAAVHLAGQAIPGGGSVILPVICVVLAIAFAFIAKTNWGGVVLDLHNDTLEFPGGGIAANEFIDYIRPEYLIQVFKRHQIPISEIREISRHNKVTKRRSDSGKVSTSVTPIITLNGSFGAVDIKFASEGKRDELYSALREINDMGIPIVNQ